MLRYEGLRFEGGAGKATYTLASLEGLHDGADMRRETVDRDHGHGVFPSEGFFSEKAVTWSGLILTDSEFEQGRAIRRLMGAGSDGQVSRLVYQGDENLWADVQRAGKPQVTTLVYGRIAQYVFRVEVPDALVFGESNADPAGVSVKAFHYGTTAATPDVRVTGSMPSGYRINGPGGKHYDVSTALTSGHEHRLDFATGWLYVDDVLTPGGVSRAEVWTVPPGGEITMTLVPVSGSGLLSVSTPDTYA